MISVFRPYLWEEEINAVAEVLRSWWVAMWPKVEEFEKRFAEFIGVEYALALNSATAALHLAAMVSEIEEKEVITTPMTFVSSNHAILYNRGIPVFTDIERDTLNISASEIEKNITPNTKAIILVHYGWQSCDMDAIMEIARKYNLKVIEDCAHATGGKYKGKMLGTIGDIGCFSFHGVKNLTTGDGGMLTTNNKEYYEKVKKLRWVWMDKDTHDREKWGQYSWYYNIDCLGYKYHMNDINAAIGIEQLKKLPFTNGRRKEIAHMYNEGLRGIEWIELPVFREYAESAHHNYVIKTPQRNELNQYLANLKISTGVHYIPNNFYDMYKMYGNPTPVAHEVWEKILTLPLYPNMTDEDVTTVIGAIRNFKV